MRTLFKILLFLAIYVYAASLILFFEFISPRIKRNSAEVQTSSERETELNNRPIVAFYEKVDRSFAAHDAEVQKMIQSSLPKLEEVFTQFQAVQYQIDDFHSTVINGNMSTKDARDKFKYFLTVLTEVQNSLVDSQRKYEEIGALSAGCSPMVKRAIKKHTEEMVALLNILVDKVGRMLEACKRLLLASKGRKYRIEI